MTPMTTRHVLAIGLALGLHAACERGPSEEAATRDPETPGSSSVASTAAGDPAVRPAPGGGTYPEPRFPSYLKPPTSVEEMLPAVRVLVRNQSGFLGKGLGILEPGDTVLLVPTAEAEDMVLEAIKRALEERKITVHIRFDYELVGLTKAKAVEYLASRRTYTAEQGYMEAAGWIQGQFPDVDAAKAWLKQQRPDLYEALFPANREMTPEMLDIYEKLKRDSVGLGIQTYLRAHPEIRGAYWAKGGGTGLRRAFHPMEEKFLGTFMYDNRWTVMSAMTSYPGDVWQLAEEQTLEPLMYVDRIEADDPEGTHVWTDLTQEMAERWAQGSYQRGHLYMFPNQASGRFGYSFVDYPAFQAKWIPREPLALLNGVIAGTNGHGGFFPRWEVAFEDGRIVDVTGGGLYGETLKTFLKYPNINEVTYPFHNNPGFWYLYEIAFGTHPKAFRDPVELMNGSAGPERQRSGVIHWGLGLRLWHDPDEPVESKTWLEFTGKYNLPRDHNFHTHTYFTTYRVHLRNAGKWIDLLDRGRLTTLDNPEVRALASRYGDPDRLLAEDWIPEVPGINAPGRYAEYAANPWATVTRVIDKVQAGTYEHFYPPATAAPAVAPTSAARE
jgi:hypothetical protein